MSSAVPSGVIAVIRAATTEEAWIAVRGLADAGVDAIEITFTVPDAPALIERASRALGIPVGAGTVRTSGQCAAAVAAGAAFVVSPGFTAEVVSKAHDLDVPVVPGALTPTEVERCVAAGAEAVKIFPIDAVGGAGYLKSLSEPYPGVRWVASGGISPDLVPAFRAAGAHAVCMGGALIDRMAARAGDVAGVAAVAKERLAPALSN